MRELVEDREKHILDQRRTQQIRCKHRPCKLE